MFFNYCFGPFFVFPADIFQTGLSNEILGIIGLIITLVTTCCSIFCCLEQARAKRAYSKLKTRLRRQEVANVDRTENASIHDGPRLQETFDNVNQSIYGVNTRLINLENEVALNQIACFSAHTPPARNSFNPNSRPASVFGTAFYDKRPPLSNLSSTSNLTEGLSEATGTTRATGATRKIPKFDFSELLKNKKAKKKSKATI
jgi:hypothetical protein